MANDSNLAAPAWSLPPTQTLPATTLRGILDTCQADEPLRVDDRRWEDFSAVRGDEAVTRLGKLFRYRAPGRWIHGALLGHRGAGKSTEIIRLVGALRDAYYPVYIAANVEMDPLLIEAEDLLLGIAVMVATRLHRDGLPLPDEPLRRVGDWFREVIQTTKWSEGSSLHTEGGASLEAKVPHVGGIFASLKSLFKQESEYRLEVKKVLQRHPSGLLDAVNSVLDVASTLIGDRSLLIIVDNLDRYSPEIADQVLVRGADRIRRLRANLLITPPISLQLKPQSELLENHYSCQNLCSVQLRDREQGYRQFAGPGRDLMEQALAKRIDLDRLIPERAARDRLIGASGGAIRELVGMTADAALSARGDAILLSDVERVLTGRRSRLRDRINANGWMDPLAAIARDKQLSSHPGCLEVLFHQLAFLYNGDGWYDVHPLVAEIPEFQRATGLLAERG